LFSSSLGPEKKGPSFDEASAVYGQFGAFYVGIRFAAEKLGIFLAGKDPVGT
jgi:hypothetical protein